MSTLFKAVVVVIPERQMKYRGSISLPCHCWIKSRKWLNYLATTCTSGAWTELVEIGERGGLQKRQDWLRAEL